MEAEGARIPSGHQKLTVTLETALELVVLSFLKNMQ